MTYRNIFQYATLAFAVIAGGNQVIESAVNGPYKDIIPPKVLMYIMSATTLINSFLPRFASLVNALQVNSNEIEIKKA